MYNKIKTHPLPSDVFAKQIFPLGTISPDEAAALKAEQIQELEDALQQ